MSDTTPCPICHADMPADAEFVQTYPGLVCGDCQAKAVDAQGREPEHNSLGDFGANPVFIDSRQCWHRYKFGGYVTMLDPDDCESEQEFYDRHLPHFAAHHAGVERLMEAYNRSVLERRD